MRKELRAKSQNRNYSFLFFYGDIFFEVATLVFVALVSDSAIQFVASSIFILSAQRFFGVVFLYKALKRKTGKWLLDKDGRGSIGTVLLFSFAAMSVASFDGVLSITPWVAVPILVGLISEASRYFVGTQKITKKIDDKIYYLNDTYLLSLTIFVTGIAAADPLFSKVATIQTIIVFVFFILKAMTIWYDLLRAREHQRIADEGEVLFEGLVPTPFYIIKKDKPKILWISTICILVHFGILSILFDFVILGVALVILNMYFLWAIMPALFVGGKGIVFNEEGIWFMNHFTYTKKILTKSPWSNIKEVNFMRTRNSNPNRKRWEYGKDVLGNVSIIYKDKTETRLNLLYYQTIPFDEVEKFLIPFVQEKIAGNNTLTS